MKGACEMALTSKVVLGRPYKVGRVVHGWSCVVGLAFLGGSPGQVILGTGADQRGKPTLYVKCLLFYTQRLLAFKPAPSFLLIR